MPRMILTITQNIQKYSYLLKANILKNILTLTPKAQAKTCLGLC
jgi:hypothetical protein